MRITLPPPLETPPEPYSFIQDFILLTKNQMKVKLNQWRHRPKTAMIASGIVLLSLLILLIFLGSIAYGVIENVPFEYGQGLLSLLFMSSLIAQIFFGITAAFSSLYMSEDLELLFMAPVSFKAVFAVKSLSVFASNFVTTGFFVFLPGIFYGLMFKAQWYFYIFVILVALGLLIIGTAIAELLNLLVMRIIPPHRSKEAVGFIGAMSGIIIVLMLQIPNIMMSSGEQFDIGSWLAGNEQMLNVMNFFPWGWGSRALVSAMSGSILAGIGWSLLIFLLGILLFSLAFSSLERSFRKGFISLSQGEGGRPGKTKGKNKNLVTDILPKNNNIKAKSSLKEIFEIKEEEKATSSKALTLAGIWAVAKKDLLYLKRDSREWFGYLTPLIFMAFFVVQYIFGGSDGSLASLITVLVTYTIMFSGNMALQSFGREGESDWLLNSVPLAGWPVVFGKLLASVLPTLVLLEALLVGTGIAINLSVSTIFAMAVVGILLSLGSSSIGLFYSINNSRFNPDNPQQRIAPGASMIMFLINTVFLLFLALGLTYIFRPAELIALLKQLPPITYEGGFWSAIIYGLYLISRPLIWPTWAGVMMGLLVTLGIWSVVFFGFMKATVNQSLKGFRVEIVTSGKKQSKIKSK